MKNSWCFFPETWLEKKQWARRTEDHQRFWFDRLCVYQGHQHQVLKAETITAIPAFIAQSKGLLVLWDDTRRFFLGGAGQRWQKGHSGERISCSFDFNFGSQWSGHPTDCNCQSTNNQRLMPVILYHFVVTSLQWEYALNLETVNGFASRNRKN